MAWTDTCRIHAVETIERTAKEKGLSVNRAIKEVSQEAEIPAATLKRWYYPGNGVGSKMSQQKKNNIQRNKKNTISGNSAQSASNGTVDETFGDVTITQAIETYVQCLYSAPEEENPSKPVAAMSWGLLFLIRRLAKVDKLSMDDVKDALEMLKSVVGILERFVAEEGADEMCPDQGNSASSEEVQPTTKGMMVEMGQGEEQCHLNGCDRVHSGFSGPEPYKPLASVRGCIGNHGSHDHCRMCSSETMCMSMSGVQSHQEVEPLVWTPKG